MGCIEPCIYEENEGEKEGLTKHVRARNRQSETTHFCKLEWISNQHDGLLSLSFHFLACSLSASLIDKRGGDQKPKQ